MKDPLMNDDVNRLADSIFVAAKAWFNSELELRLRELRGVVEQRFEKLPTPNDGKDGAPGRNGRDGVDGKDFDIELLTTRLAETLPPMIEQLQGQMKERIDTWLSEIPPPLNGKDGEDGKDGVDGRDGVGTQGERGERGEPGERGASGEPGANGRDGVDGTRGEAGERGEPGPPGRDGVDGVNGPDGERGEAGPQGERGERGESGLHGKDGRDGIDGERGEPGLQGERGERGEQGLNGKDGVDGVDGKDGIDGLHGKDGVDGRDGLEGKAGEPGRDALQLDILPAIDETRSYARNTYAAHKGGVWVARMTTRGMVGWECVWRGLDVIEFEESDDGRTLVEKHILSDGTTFARARTTPFMIYRGIWREGVWHPGDTCTWQGSLWHCDEETSDKPSEIGAKGWTLAAKRGRDGKDGLRGERGERGDTGRAGRDLTQMAFNGAKT